MKKIEKQKIETYIKFRARPVDRALYAFHFHEGSSEAVIDALRAYQNVDGGFGNAIEPDFRVPESSVLGTSVAFQYLVAVGADSREALVQQGIEYLRNTYSTERNGWAIIPNGDAHPHAPWWDYEFAMAQFGWGNPSAEILGYLMTYRDVVRDPVWLNEITDAAVSRLSEIREPDFHEVLNYLRLHRHANEILQRTIFINVAELMKNVVSTTPGEWDGYVAQPLTFIDSPESSFAYLFDEDLLKTNLEHLVRGLVEGDHWEPSWNWGELFPETWQQAKEEWSGKLTVSNMIRLKNFGKLK